MTAFVLATLLSVAAAQPSAPCPCARSSPPSQPETRPRAAEVLGPRRALQPLGHAGIGLLATGVVVGGVGAGMLAVRESRPRFNKSRVRDLRPAGIGLVGVGGGAAVAGLAMLLADRVAARKPSRFALQPLIAPSASGVSIHGRF